MIPAWSCLALILSLERRVTALEVQHDAAEGGEVLRGMAGADATLVFIHLHIRHPMKLVLNSLPSGCARHGLRVLP